MPIVFPTPERQPSIEELVERERRRIGKAQQRVRKRRSRPPKGGKRRAAGSPRVCRAKDCERGDIHGHGLCVKHYMRKYRRRRHARPDLLE